MSTLTELETIDRLARFGQLALISDPNIKFLNSRNGFNNHKRQENINYTLVKYGETIQGRRTVSTLTVVKVNRLWKEWSLRAM